MIPNLRSLILSGESETLDFKNTISNSYKIAKTLCAFANNKGGILLIGVRDDGSIKGVKEEEEEKYMLEKAANQYCKPVIDLKYEEATLDDKLILIVTVPTSDDKPYYSIDEDQNWWAYIRIKDKSILASSVLLEVLKNRDKVVKITYNSAEKKLFHYLESNQSISLNEYSKLTRLSNKKAIKILSDLIIAGVLVPIDSGIQERYVQIQQ